VSIFFLEFLALRQLSYIPTVGLSIYFVKKRKEEEALEKKETLAEEVDAEESDKGQPSSGINGSKTTSDGDRKEKAA